MENKPPRPKGRGIARKKPTIMTPVGNTEAIEAIYHASLTAIINFSIGVFRITPR
jgi:hypothetical protein